MPEGHTLHRLANQHNKLFARNKLEVTSPQGRFVDDAKRVTGRVLRKVDAVGKHLFYRFDNKLTVHVHLGLRGGFRVQQMDDGDVPDPRGAVRMRLVGGNHVVDLSGPTACHVLDAKQTKTLIDRIGPDVLDPKADVARVKTMFARRSTPVGTLLMDQSVLSGIGNIYRAELLYRHHLHPLTPAKEVGSATFNAIWADAVNLLKLGVKHGIILTVDEADLGVPLKKATKLDRFNIYKRPTCRNCGAKIKTLTLAGRVCYYCPKEQKR